MPNSNTEGQFKRVKMRQQIVTSKGTANFWHTSHITYTSQIILVTIKQVQQTTRKNTDPSNDTYLLKL
jgi:hypothetical protein